MNKGMLGVGIILMGVIALLMINIISNFSSGGELDYYLLKETSDASLVDALDKDFYTNYGLYRIDKEKYAESFLRRFAQNVDGTRSYEVQIIDINELPPKVSVRVTSDTVLHVNSKNVKDSQGGVISTQIDEIIEANSTDDLNFEAFKKKYE